MWILIATDIAQGTFLQQAIGANATDYTSCFKQWKSGFTS